MSILDPNDPLFYNKQFFVGEITKVVADIGQKVSVWRDVGVKAANEARAYEDDGVPAGPLMTAYMQGAGITSEEAAARLLAHAQHIEEAEDFCALFALKVWEICPLATNEDVHSVGNGILIEGYTFSNSVIGNPFEYIPPT